MTTVLLLLHLAFGNMPPPPPNTCPRDGVGAECRTKSYGKGVCVKSTCPRTEMGPNGAKTTEVECLVCAKPPEDGGTK